MNWGMMTAWPESDRLEWNRDNDNFEVLRRSDIMISDFSGVIFDFVLVFGKPVIYADTSFDKSPYDAAWLDEELWTLQVLPKIGRPLKQEEFGSLKAKIDEMLASPQVQDAIDEARKETWSHIVESVRLTVDYLEAKQKELSGSGEEK